MSDQKTSCQSCGMPIESGPYCQYCSDEHGELQCFDERFARMQQWMRRESPALSPEAVEAKTLQYMSTMPAWREHPELLKRLRSS